MDNTQQKRRAIMKRIRTSMLAIMALWLFAVPGFAYTVTVGVDASILAAVQIDEIYVFTDIPPVVSGVNSWTVTPGTGLPAGWVVVLDFGSPGATGGYDTASASRIDYDITPFGLTGAPLSPGIVLSITDPSNSLPAFGIHHIDLYTLSLDGSSISQYAGVYSIIQNGTDYTVSAVPIPAAAWLLGSGVVGLVALKRRKKNG
jgi:hypothetical protein